jgi:hypothetical protein
MRNVSSVGKASYNRDTTSRLNSLDHIAEKKANAFAEPPAPAPAMQGYRRERIATHSAFYHI